MKQKENNEKMSKRPKQRLYKKKKEKRISEGKKHENFINLLIIIIIHIETTT